MAQLTRYTISGSCKSSHFLFVTCYYSSPAVKEYIVDVWEIQKHKFGQNGKLSQNGMSDQKGKVHLGPNVSSSAHDSGCVVNGGGAMAAI